MSHKHTFERECVEIADDVCVAPSLHGGNPNVTEADGSIAGGPERHLAGFFIAFDCDGCEYRTEGVVNVDPHFVDRPIWQMTGSLDDGDLSLTPSVLMHAGPGERRERHGYVTNGKWVPV